MNGRATVDQRRWYVVQTRPRQVRRAEENLRNQGYTIYIPEWGVEKIYRNKRVKRSEPLFPNYIFIRLQVGADDWSPIRSTRGVQRLVAFGSEPVPVADGVIEQIRKRVGDAQQKSALSHGDRVEITNGAFRGLEAVFDSFDGDERVVLLLRILEQQVRTTSPLSHIKRC